VTILSLFSESVYRMRKNDEAFLYVVYGLRILNVQLTDFRSRDSAKLKAQCKQLRHTLIRTLIRQTVYKKLSDDETIQRYFTGKLLFRAGQCARRHGQLLFAYFCVLNATLSLLQCHLVLTSYEHCQSLTLLAELSHDLKRMEDCDLFVQAIVRYIEHIRVGYETIAIKSHWLSMTWNLYRGKIDHALNDSYKIKDLLNKIGAYEHLMTVVTYGLQVNGNRCLVYRL
jgi:chloramphenicol O-acetyltransferase